MMKEATLVSFRKVPTGIIGKTTNSRIIQIWGKSQHKCSDLLQNLDNLRNRDEPNMAKHKEGNTAIIKNNQADHTKLKSFLITGIHPLQSESHTLTSLCNIYTSQIE